MAVSISQLGYKKLSQIIFEWQAADKASLLAFFMMMETMMHWLWCLFVWWNQAALDDYVNLHLLYPLWIGVTLVGLFFWWMIAHLARIKNNPSDLYKWQVVLIVPYTIYLTIAIVMMGYSSLFAGVSLVGGAMLGMMLIRRRYIWRMFLVQIVLVLLAVVSPYFGVGLPNLRQVTITYPIFDTYSYLTYNEIMIIENAIAASIFQSESLGWDSINGLRRSSAFFWRSTHIYLAIPKAFFIVYAFRTLLLILDDSKREILQHANKDELTALDNRRYGLTKMRQALKEATDTQECSVILLDLDLFKGINDSYGHEVGDQVLKEVAQVLINTLTKKDIISRYGGEEFLITLPDTAHDEAMAIAETLRVNISRHLIQIDDRLSFAVTASLGLYTLAATELAYIKQHHITTVQKSSPQNLSKRHLFKLSNHKKREGAALRSLPSDICQQLINIADKALYHAKDTGRNKVVSANELVAAETITPLRYGT